MIAARPAIAPASPRRRIRTSSAPAAATARATRSVPTDSEIELDLGRALFPLDHQLQRPVLGGPLADSEEDQRPLDRPHLRGRVDLRDLAAAVDLLSELQRVQALALDRGVLRLGRIDDHELRRDRD